MNDPHVVSLQYRLVWLDNITVENPPSVVWQTPAGAFRLADDILLATPSAHHATVENARRAVEPFLKAYGLQTMFTFKHAVLEFRYLDADIVDRNPRPLRPGALPEITGALNVSLAPATLTGIGHCGPWLHYPPPPFGLAVTPDVETLWHRYEGYKAGRELLTGMAYFCLTLVEKVIFDDREEAASKLAISANVLRELRHLANVGDNKTARKADISERRPHKPEELAWLEKVVQTLIERMAEYAFDANAARPKVTMAELPPLG